MLGTSMFLYFITTTFEAYIYYPSSECLLRYQSSIGFVYCWFLQLDFKFGTQSWPN